MELSDALSYISLAVAVLSALFAGLAVRQTWVYLPRPLWVGPMVHSISATGRTVDGVQVADAVWRVDNRGLAPATDVELQIRIGSDAWVRVDGVPTPVIQPGESVEFAMAIPLANAGPPEAGIPSPLVYDWAPRDVRIRWRQAPNLRRVRSSTRSIREPPT